MSKIGALVILMASLSAAWGQKDSILIGPGDVIHIQVLEAPSLEQHVRVTDAGTIPLILGGEVKIGGLDAAAGATSIARALSTGQYVLDPHVTVTVDHYATQNVSVLGQVHSPGSYSIDTPRTLIDVLALAGGLTDLADRSITVERRGSNERASYFLSNQSDKALSDNLTIYPGDIVMVPKAAIVYVLGDVGRPGGFPVTTNSSKMSLLEAIALAGSTQPSAVPSNAKLIRRKENGSYVIISLQLSKIQKGKSSDIDLQADDIVYVPFSYLRNMGGGLSGLIGGAASATIYRY
jgi:polysaccharide export outer membrane protein